jgi:hypothetical protein
MDDGQDCKGVWVSLEYGRCVFEEVGWGGGLTMITLSWFREGFGPFGKVFGYRWTPIWSHQSFLSQKIKLGALRK